jgi:PUA domain protein
MSARIKNLHQLKRKDIKRLNQVISDQFEESFLQDNSQVEIGKIDDRELIFIDKKAWFFKQQDQFFFTIPGLLSLHPKKRKVVVDMGAVKFVTNGADVMAPGIVDADPMIDVDHQVWICDEQHGKPLAVGIALISGEEMVENRTGKAVRLVHYVGDRLWDLIQSSEER